MIQCCFSTAINKRAASTRGSHPLIRDIIYLRAPREYSGRDPGILSIFTARIIKYRRRGVVNWIESGISFAQRDPTVMSDLINRSPKIHAEGVADVTASDEEKKAREIKTQRTGEMSKSWALAITPKRTLFIRAIIRGSNIPTSLPKNAANGERYRYLFALFPFFCWRPRHGY